MCSISCSEYCTFNITTLIINCTMFYSVSDSTQVPISHHEHPSHFECASTEYLHLNKYGVATTAAYAHIAMLPSLSCFISLSVMFRTAVYDIIKIRCTERATNGWFNGFLQLCSPWCRGTRCILYYIICVYILRIYVYAYNLEFLMFCICLVFMYNITMYILCTWGYIRMATIHWM